MSAAEIAEVKAGIQDLKATLLPVAATSEAAMPGDSPPPDGVQRIATLRGVRGHRDPPVSANPGKVQILIDPRSEGKRCKFKLNALQSVQREAAIANQNNASHSRKPSKCEITIYRSIQSQRVLRHSLTSGHNQAYKREQLMLLLAYRRFEGQCWRIPRAPSAPASTISPT